MRDTLRKGAILILLFLCLLASCQKKDAAPSGEEEDVQEKTKDQTTDLIRDDSHEEITWDREAGHYVEYDSDTFGWQSIETEASSSLRWMAGVMLRWFRSGCVRSLQ